MPPCRQQFGEILYSAKADPVPNIAHPTFAFRSCLGFILIFECPGELDIIICGWRSTIFFLSLIPATVPPSVINDLCWIESFWWWKREKEGETWEVSWAATSERMPLARSVNMIEIMNKIIDELMNESMARRGKMAGKQGTGGPRRTVGGCHWRETGDLLGKVIFCSLFQMVFFVSLTFLTDFQENKCSLYTVDTCCLLADQRVYRMLCLILGSTNRTGVQSLFKRHICNIDQSHNC